MTPNEEIKSYLVSKFFNGSSQTDQELIVVLESFINEYKTQKKIHQVPVGIFANKNLGILESTVKYLKENNNLTYHEIAVLLKRDDRTIWATYHKAIRKEKNIFSTVENGQTIDLNIISNREQAPLQALIRHLKSQGLNFRQISQLLNRSYKTVWVTYNKKK